VTTLVTTRGAIFATLVKMQQVRQIRENIHNTNAQRSWNGDQGDDFAHS